MIRKVNAAVIAALIRNRSKCFYYGFSYNGGKSYRWQIHRS